MGTTLRRLGCENSVNSGWKNLVSKCGYKQLLLLGWVEDTSIAISENGGWHDTYKTELWILKKAAPVPNALTQVLDINNQLVDSSAVNYANVYLYGTDGNPKHDTIASKTIDPANPPSAPWNASAKHWRVHILTSLDGAGRTSADVVSKNAVTAYLRVTEMHFTESDGVVSVPTSVGVNGET